MTTTKLYIVDGWLMAKHSDGRLEVIIHMGDAQ